MASAVYYSCDCCVPPSPRESFVTQTNSQATLVALCRLSKQPPGNSLERKKSTAHSKKWKTNGAWNTEWGENAECIFTLLLQRFHAPLSFLHWSFVSWIIWEDSKGAEFKKFKKTWAIFPFFTLQKFDNAGQHYHVTKNNLNSGVVAQFVRFLPETWHRSPCLRVEIYGTRAQPFPGNRNRWKLSWYHISICQSKKENFRKEPIKRRSRPQTQENWIDQNVIMFKFASDHLRGWYEVSNQ